MYVCFTHLNIIETNKNSKNFFVDFGIILENKSTNSWLEYTSTDCFASDLHFASCEIQK